MKSLSSMNFESNELKICPPELGLLKNLNHLILGQNTLRGISSEHLNGGTTKLLTYLANRCSSDYVEPSWVELARQGKSPSGDELAPPSSDTMRMRTDSGRLGARFYRSQTPEGRASEMEEVLSAKTNLTEKLTIVENEIEELSMQLEKTMSAATAHATKRKLSIKKAEKKRVERQLENL
jgi:Leucine-rich repeat (LRR) protein